MQYYRKKAGINERFYWVAKIAIDYYCLTSKGALLFEALFGFKRSRATKRSSSFNLACVLLENCLPQIKKATDEAFEAYFYGEKYAARFFQKAFTKLYPAVHFTYESLFVAFMIAFLLGKSVHYSPVFYVLNEILVREQQFSTDHVHKSTSGLFDKIISTAKWIVPSAVLLMHSIDLWSKADAFKPKNIYIPPPCIPKPEEKGLFPTKNTKYCPLCAKLMVDVAALPSGYRFCHSCIMPYVKNKRQCPISGLAYSPSDIVRLFGSQ